MSKHTAGPWKAGWETTSGLTGPRCAPTVFLKDTAVQVPIHKGSDPIAWVLSSSPDEMADADARLIAASPTMYEYIQQRANDGCDTASLILEAINA